MLIEGREDMFIVSRFHIGIEFSDLLRSPAELFGGTQSGLDDNKGIAIRTFEIDERFCMSDDSHSSDSLTPEVANVFDTFFNILLTGIRYTVFGTVAQRSHGFVILSPSLLYFLTITIGQFDRLLFGEGITGGVFRFDIAGTNIRRIRGSAIDIIVTLLRAHGSHAASKQREGKNKSDEREGLFHGIILGCLVLMGLV